MADDSRGLLSAWGRSLLALVCLGIAFVVQAAGGQAASPSSAGGEVARTRGVRLLDPGDPMLPLVPFPEVTPGFLARIPSSLEKVRIAVADGQAAQLDGLAPRAVAFEVVPATSDPDLVWSAQSGNASVGGQVIAYGVDRKNLPAVIDRTAVARALVKEGAARPQPVALVSGGATARKGDKVEIEVGNVEGRTLILLTIAGDGTVQVLYPRGGDARVVSGRTFRWAIEVREPFGTDLIVAISAPEPLDALEQGLAQISRHRSAGEIVKLLSIAAPADARLGTVAIRTEP